MARRLLLGLAIGLVLTSVGCATTPYEIRDDLEGSLTLRLADGEPQIERGRPNAWLDGFGHYFFSLPSKLLLLRWRMNNHDVSPEVERRLEQYLVTNGLCNTKGRVNQYAPGAEFKRLFRNKEMPAGWRYTLGLASVAFYTIFPDRLFAGFPLIGGGDSFNPFTNTIHIYSDLPEVALHEGGHAKDLAEIGNRHLKGLYSGVRAVPLLGLPLTLWQEAEASSEALSWALATGDAGDSRAAYRTLYPAYGTYLGGTVFTATSLFRVDAWILYAAQFGTIVAGHVAGQTRALFESDRDQGLEPGLTRSWTAPPPDGMLAAAMSFDAPPVNRCRPAPRSASELPPLRLEPETTEPGADP